MTASSLSPGLIILLLASVASKSNPGHLCMALPPFYSFLSLHTYSKRTVAHFSGVPQDGAWQTSTNLTFPFLQQERPVQLLLSEDVLSQPWASWGSVLVCGSLKEECLTKFKVSQGWRLESQQYL